MIILTPRRPARETRPDVGACFPFSSKLINTVFLLVFLNLHKLFLCPTRTPLLLSADFAPRANCHFARMLLLLPVGFVPRAVLLRACYCCTCCSQCPKCVDVNATPACAWAHPKEAQGVIYVDSCMLQCTVGTKPSGAGGVQYPCGDQS